VWLYDLLVEVVFLILEVDSIFKMILQFSRILNGFKMFVVIIYTSNLYMIRLHGAQGKKT